MAYMEYRVVSLVNCQDNQLLNHHRNLMAHSYPRGIYDHMTSHETKQHSLSITHQKILHCENHQYFVSTIQQYED